MRFEYTGIRVRDLQRSIQFYTKTMGLKQVRKGTMREGGKYVQLIDPESKQQLELNYYPPGTKYHEEYVEGSELDHLAFWCKDVPKHYKQVVDGGATPTIEPWDEGGYTLAFVRDPDGVWIELIGKKVKSTRDKIESAHSSTDVTKRICRATYHMSGTRFLKSILRPSTSSSLV